MTKEKAREILATWLVASKGTEEQLGYIEGWFSKEDEEAFRMAIEALEQETVSREKYTHEYCLRKKFEMKAFELEKKVAEQEPRLACEDIISRQTLIDEMLEDGNGAVLSYPAGIYEDELVELIEKQMIEYFIKVIESLPPAEPRRLKGECRTCKRCSDHCCETDEDFTRCPIEEHYALPKDGYCHLYQQI